MNKIPPEFEWIKPGVKVYNTSRQEFGEVGKGPYINYKFYPNGELQLDLRENNRIFLCKYFIPAEFAWIKKGVQVDLKEDAWHGRGIEQTLTVVSDPFYIPNLNKCVVQCRPDFGLLMWCEELQPAKNPKITLTLTRHQAQALLLQMQKLDGVSRGFIEDEKFYREIEKQIEEKLK